jgi:hypothetical protein
MEKEITAIFLDKEFHELSASEKEQIKDLCENEEDFEQMRFLFSGMAQIRTQDVQPSDEIKKSLDGIFAEVHGSKDRVFWYNTILTLVYPTDKAVHKRPLVQIAALLTVILLTVPFFRNEELAKTSAIQVAEQKVEDKSDDNGAKGPVQDNSPAVNTENQINGTTDRMPTDFSVQDTDDSGAEMIADVLNEDVVRTMSRAEAAPASGMAFAHPDGVYMGETAVFSISTADVPEVLDLITAVF